MNANTPRPVTIEMFAACEQSGRPLQAPPAPRELEVTPATIANGYEIWPTGRRGKRIGPKILVVELKVQA